MMRHVSLMLAGVVLVAMASAACTSGTNNNGPAGDDAQPQNSDDEVVGSDGTRIDLATIENRLIGLSVEDAQAQADMWGLPFRVGRLDDEQYALTFDYIEGRITVEADTMDGVETVTSLTVELPLDDA